MWEIRKPDRDGIWLWRLPDKKHRGMGVIRINGNRVESLGVSPTLEHDLDVWWSVCHVEMFYVEGA